MPRLKISEDTSPLPHMTSGQV